MAQHDFLGAVLPEAGAGFSPDTIPGREELARRAALLDDTAEALDLVHLEGAERGEVGGPSTVDERELNGAYGDLATAAPEVLTLRGRPATIFQDALELEDALVRLREANARVLQTSRAGVLLLGAELTARNDQIEEVVAEGRGAAGEAERAEWEAIFAGVALVRLGDRDQQRARSQRRALRKDRQDRLLRAAQEEPQRLLQVEALRTAPLSLAAPRLGRRGSATKALAKGKGPGKDRQKS